MLIVLREKLLRRFVDLTGNLDIRATANREGNIIITITRNNTKIFDNISVKMDSAKGAAAFLLAFEEFITQNSDRHFVIEKETKTCKKRTRKKTG